MLKKLVVLVFTLSVSFVVYSFVQDNTAQTHRSSNNAEQASQSVKFTTTAYQASNGKAPIDKDKISQLFKVNTGIIVQEVKHSVLPGMVEILTDQGLFYGSADGSFLFIDGQLYGFEQGITNYTEQSMAPVRVAGMKKFENGMIVYPAKDEKHVITVFTDITCGYCRRMHAQMDEYNKLGITVRYLAYPRSGIVDRQSGGMTQGFKDLRSVWCNEDPKKALTSAKAGQPIPQRICEQNIAEEFNFGRQVGVNGTPAIMLENGDLIPGFVPPSDLIQRIARR